MEWQDYIPVKNIQIVLRHTISCAFAIFCFWLLFLLVKALIPEGYFHHVVEIFEEVGLVIIFLFFLYEMIQELRKGGRGNGALHILLAA